MHDKVVLWGWGQWRRCFLSFFFCYLRLVKSCCGGSDGRIKHCKWFATLITSDTTSNDSLNFYISLNSTNVQIRVSKSLIFAIIQAVITSCEAFPAVRRLAKLVALKANDLLKHEDMTHHRCLCMTAFIIFNSLNSTKGPVTVHVTLNVWNCFLNVLGKKKDKGSLARSKHRLRLHVSVTKKRGKMFHIQIFTFFVLVLIIHSITLLKTFTVALKTKNYNSAQSISLTPTLPCNHGNDHSLPYSSLCHCNLTSTCHCSLTYSCEFQTLWFHFLPNCSWDTVNKSLLLILRWPFW